MKLSAVTAAALVQLATALPAAPAVDVSGVDFTKIKYPAGTGENLPYYPPPPGGWENVKYPPGTGANAPVAGAPATPAAPSCPDAGKASVASPFKFTSYFSIKATPDQVVNANGTAFTGGLAGATGLYELGFNSAENVVCYNITLYNFRGDYQSPADTATHLHQGARGAAGPPRIAFANPVPVNGDASLRRSLGCIQGPFVTGLNDTARPGVDSGEGFSVSQIEANPAGFFIDVHSSLAVPGAVRGQLA